MTSYPNDPYRDVEGGATKSVTDAAGDVKDVGLAAGKDVLETAKVEGAQVVEEAKVQGRRLLDESVSELRSQASTVQSRLADTVQALTDELRTMAAAPDADGPLADLANAGHDYGERAAAWLRDNDLDQALSGVRRYAARNPWAFLAIAGGAGLLVGRLARGLRDAAEPDVARRVDTPGIQGARAAHDPYAAPGPYLADDPYAAPEAYPTPGAQPPLGGPTDRTWEGA